MRAESDRTALAIALVFQLAPSGKGQLLDRTIIWNERQLRALLVEYIDRYNQHRPHRGINQRAPNDTAVVTAIRPGHPIERRSICAGLINEYRPAA